MNLREVPTNAFDMTLSRSRVTMPRRREVEVISSYPVNTFDTILLSPKIDKKGILKKLRDRELGKIAHFPILKKGKGREEGYEEEKCGERMDGGKKRKEIEDFTDYDELNELFEEAENEIDDLEADLESTEYQDSYERRLKRIRELDEMMAVRSASISRSLHDAYENSDKIRWLRKKMQYCEDMINEEKNGKEGRGMVGGKKINLPGGRQVDISDADDRLWGVTFDSMNNMLNSLITAFQRNGYVPAYADRVARFLQDILDKERILKEIADRNGFSREFEGNPNYRVFREHFETISDWINTEAREAFEYRTMLDIIEDNQLLLEGAVQQYGLQSGVVKDIVDKLNGFFDDIMIYRNRESFRNALQEINRLDTVYNRFGHVVADIREDRGRNIGKDKEDTRPSGGIREFPPDDEGLAEMEMDEFYFNEDVLTHILNDLSNINTKLGEIYDVVDEVDDLEILKARLKVVVDEFSQLIVIYNVVLNDGSGIENVSFEDQPDLGENIADLRDNNVNLIEDIERAISYSSRARRRRRIGDGRKTKKSKIGRLVILDGKN